MKKFVFVGLTAIVLAAAASAASAGRFHHHGHHHHHHHGGLSLGFSFGSPWYWGHSYYPYYRSPVFEREPVFLERRPMTYIQRDSDYWYYCRAPSGYYPYVSNCPSGWMQVVPQTVPPR